jgi:pilus assembly protein Flp/PilA
MKDGKLQRALRPLARLMAHEDGITAIEYGLVAALISVFVMVAIGAVGDAVIGLFQQTANAFPD